MNQRDHGMENKNPDIVSIEKGRKLCWIKDIAYPGDKKVCDKEN